MRNQEEIQDSDFEQVPTGLQASLLEGDMEAEKRIISDLKTPEEIVELLSLSLEKEESTLAALEREATSVLEKRNTHERIFAVKRRMKQIKMEIDEVTRGRVSK